MAITKEERARRKREREAKEHARAMDLHWNQSAVSALASGEPPAFERRVIVGTSYDDDRHEVWIRAYRLNRADGGVVVVSSGESSKGVRFFAAYGAESWATTIRNQPYTCRRGGDHELRAAASELYAAIVEACNAPQNTSVSDPGRERI